jgi:peptidyl-prolyl cis-trans isomerase A (cyclophilin A)
MKSKGKLFIFIIMCMTLFMGLEEKNPEILILTELGDITVEIYSDKAPITANNFLAYVDEGQFKDSCFYRVVTLANQPEDNIKIEVIQGGLAFSKDRKLHPPISHEKTETTGIKHEDGVISMARIDPGSATSEFFICVGDQPELDFGGRRNPDGMGFSAFGKVTEGMEVVRKIHNSSAEGQELQPRIRIFNIVRKE